MPRRKLNDLSIPGHCWQRSNGRWSGRYYDTDGGRHQVTLDSQSEVIEWLREIDKRRRLGRYIPPSELTVSDLIERWLEQGEVYQSHKPVTRPDAPLGHEHGRAVQRQSYRQLPGGAQRCVQ
jgi:hypothetical protein